MSTSHIGIDVGIKGAVVRLDAEGGIMDNMAFPDIGDTYAEFRKAVALSDFITAKHPHTTDSITMEAQWFGQFEVERAGKKSTVGMSRKAIATYARQVGFVFAYVGLLPQLQFNLIRPKEWQNVFVGKVKSVKVASVQRAKARWPERHDLFKGPMGTHYADACWLAEWGRLHGPQR